MIINQAGLDRLYTGFQTAFNNGLGQAKSQWNRVATKVPSSTREEKYGWLGKIPNMREWIGDRVVNNIGLYDYSIRNKPWESTIGVDRDDIEDDTYGVYGPLFEEMGRSTAALPDQLVFNLLKAGFSTLCYDSQNFFDTDHPVLDENGNPVSVANTDNGAGAPWFLIDDSRALKPILFQNRRDPVMTRLDRPDDPEVFNRKEFRYGVDSRSNVGFGFWQFAWASKQTLDVAHYQTARESLMGMKGDYARPLGIMPRLLVVGPSNEHAALRIINAELLSDGNGNFETNVYKGTAEVVVVPWLA